MPFAVQCSCGKTYQVDEGLAGKRVKCKACGSALVVPEKQPVAVAMDDDEFRLAPLDAPPAAAAPKAAGPRAAATITAAVPAAAAAVPAVASAPVTKAPVPASTTAAAAPTGGLPFFLAVSQGWAKSLLYRVYVDRDALLLLDVGPYNVMLDPEVARRADGSHWGVKTVQSLKTSVLSLIALVGGVLGLLGIGIARAGFQNPQQALQLVSFLVTIAAFAIPGIILLLTWSLRVVVLRTQQLDALSADGVRQECATGGDKYRLAPGELSDVRVASPKNPGEATRQLAEVTFKHPSGSWKLLLMSSLDVKVAIPALRRLLGVAVEIDPALERM
jgi:hypothetical protein